MLTVKKMGRLVDPDFDFAVRIVMDSDLNDLSYLYQYGEYVSPEIEEMARYLNSLPEGPHSAHGGHVHGEGYRLGFVKAHIDLSTKQTVDLHYMLGFERVVRAAVKNFEKMGLNPTIYRCLNTILTNPSFAKGVILVRMPASSFCTTTRTTMHCFWTKTDEQETRSTPPCV